MTAASIAVFPAAALAEEVVPPGNSAVNQYTETIPTPGGGRNTESKGGKQRQSPEKALGTRNAQQLEKHGSDGRATADLAAETAPSTVTTSPEPTEGAEAASGGDDTDQKQAAAGGSGGDRGGGNDGRGRGKAAIGPAQAVAVTVNTRPVADAPEGSSGLGEVVGEATGGSSGQLGLLLPLLIVAVAIWSVAYLLRQRRQAG